MRGPTPRSGRWRMEGAGRRWVRAAEASGRFRGRWLRRTWAPEPAAPTGRRTGATPAEAGFAPAPTVTMGDPPGTQRPGAGADRERQDIGFRLEPPVDNRRGT